MKTSHTCMERSMIICQTLDLLLCGVEYDYIPNSPTVWSGIWLYTKLSHCMEWSMIIYQTLPLYGVEYDYIPNSPIVWSGVWLYTKLSYCMEGSMIIWYTLLQYEEKYDYMIRGVSYSDFFVHGEGDTFNNNEKLIGYFKAQICVCNKTEFMHKQLKRHL